MLILLTIILSFLTTILTAESYTNDFKIWGPGLKPNDVIMPARYFFISPNNYSCGSEEKLIFDIKIEGRNNKRNLCRIWTNLLNTQHCLYIVRYKLYETCSDLTIEVKYNNEHIAESPYLFTNDVYSDDCNCGIQDIESWLENWDCGEIPNQIISDLSRMKSIEFNLLRSKLAVSVLCDNTFLAVKTSKNFEIISAYNNPGAVSLCHYVVKNNEIFRHCYGKYVGFKMFMDNILLSLTRKVVLPDMEFFLNLGDWPLAKTSEFPIFSWCGSDDSYDIILPTYDITESTLENMGRVMLDMLSVQGNVHHSWEQRTPKLFWRGRDSNQERLMLIDLSRKFPQLFNVSLTNFFFFRDKEKEYGPKTDHVSFFDFFDYKYQLNIDGTVAAYRFPYLLAGGSLIFKQKSKYYEHFYGGLTPNHHYIPIERDLSDLIEKINWAFNNDEEAEAIANNGWKFALQNLLPKDIFCYHVFLFNEYSKKINSNIQKLDGMELVQTDNKCNCDKIKDEL